MNTIITIIFVFSIVLLILSISFFWSGTKESKYKNSDSSKVKSFDKNGLKFLIASVIMFVFSFLLSFIQK
jgi:preprotein translocase subunit SecY